MKKQFTAVEQLDIMLLGVISFDSEELRRKYKEALAQAIAIEKKQNEHYIRFAYMAGFNRGLDNNPNHLEEYIEYIKTFDL
jgi:hypothetical protein